MTHATIVVATVTRVPLLQSMLWHFEKGIWEQRFS